MNRVERELSIRRILVALDASTQSLGTLETAAELAARLGAELTGLFVEDINLVHAAGLPFTREVSFFSEALRELEIQQVERQFRTHANLIRQALAAVAQRANVPWHFRVARGPVALEVLSAAAEADLVIMGKVGRSLSGPRRIGSTVRMVLFEGKGLTLILQESRLVVPIMVVYDGSPLSQKALHTAEQFVKTKNGHLTVFVVGSTRDSVEGLQEDVRKRLQSRKMEAHFHLLIDPSISRLAHLIQIEGGGPVVAPYGEGFLHGEGLCALVNEIRNPLLLVR